MEYTGRKVTFTAHEREDGFWRLWVALRQEKDSDYARYPVDHAWKTKPLAFDSESWTTLALLQEAVAHMRALCELEGEEHPDQLDLWGQV